MVNRISATGITWIWQAPALTPEQKRRVIEHLRAIEKQRRFQADLIAQDETNRRTAK